MTRLAMLLLIAACYGQPRAAPYKVPEAKLEAIYPKGLRVTEQEFASEVIEPVDYETFPALIKGPTATAKRSIKRTPRQALCAPSETVVQGQGLICQYSLLFSEEFDKNSLKELTNWKAANEFVDQPDYPFNAYESSNNTIRFEDGSLVISPVLTDSVKGNGFISSGKLDFSDRCTGKKNTLECTRTADGAKILPPVLTGKITTKGKFAFKYGRVEIRAKLPAGAWLIPELNLEPLENVYGSKRYESGLIRVAFAKGNRQFDKQLYGGAVFSDAEPYRSLILKEKKSILYPTWNNDFHNYTLMWKPDGLQMLVDGNQYGLVDPGEGFFIAKVYGASHTSAWKDGTLMAPLDQMFYVSLGLRVGGIHDFADSADKPWKNRSTKGMLNFWNAKDSWFPSWEGASLRVDSVKVFAL